MTFETAARFFLSCIFLAVSASAAAGPDPEMLRSVTDGARNRVYSLVRDGVEVRDGGSRSRAAFVALRDWVWVGEEYSCPPAMAFAPEGDVLVTSNVIPVIWRIDRRTLAAKAYKLTLEQDQGLDVGFISIRWVRNQGVFVAVSNSGARWIVDASLSRARMAGGIVDPEAGQMRLKVCM